MRDEGWRGLGPKLSNLRDIFYGYKKHIPSDCLAIANVFEDTHQEHKHAVTSRMKEIYWLSLSKLVLNHNIDFENIL